MKRINILFIGRSYTYFNDLPSLFNTICVKLGQKVHVDMIAYRNRNLNWHCTNKETLEKLRSKKWDYVILQEESFVLLNEVNIYFMAVHNLTTIITELGAKPVLFQTWPLESSPESQITISENSFSLAQKLKIPIVPVGEVWAKFKELEPQTSLYMYDKSHPNYLGTYITALTFYTVLFKKGITFVPNNFELCNGVEVSINERLVSVIKDICRTLLEGTIKVSFIDGSSIIGLSKNGRDKKPKQLHKLSFLNKVFKNTFQVTYEEFMLYLQPVLEQYQYRFCEEIVLKKNEDVQFVWTNRLRDRYLLIHMDFSDKKRVEEHVDVKKDLFRISVHIGQGVHDILESKWSSIPICKLVDGVKSEFSSVYLQYLKNNFGVIVESITKALVFDNKHSDVFYKKRKEIAAAKEVPILRKCTKVDGENVFSDVPNERELKLKLKFSSTRER